MPLRYILLNQSDNPRLFRWKYLLQEYGAELYFIKGESNLEADYMSRYSWRAPASHELVAMQDHFIHASKDSPLPMAYPETFMPDVWQRPFRDVDLDEFQGPIVALADCCSWEPKGPMKALAERLSHVRDFYKLRIPASADSPFCPSDAMNTLGTFTKLTGDGPDVFLVFNSLFHLSSSDRDTELKEAREKAPPELREMMTKNNHQERHFYAQVALESLLDSWNPSRPSDYIYILSHVDHKDRGKDKLVALLHQFAYGCSLAGATPTILHGKMFRNRGAPGPTVNWVQQANDPWQFSINATIRSTEREFPWSYEELRAAQQADPALQALYRHLQGDPALPTDGSLLSRFPLSHFGVTNGLVYYKAYVGEKGTQPQVCLPKDLRPLALKYCHETLTGHGGIAKTQYALRQCFYWPTAYKDLTHHIRTCLVCQSIKSGHRDSVLAGKTYLPILPFDCLAIDLVSTGRKTSRGNLYILVVVDIISRYAWFLPAKSREATHLADLLIKNIFDHWGLPKYLMSDRAGEFSSKHFAAVLGELEIRHHKTTPYNPQSNGVVERTNGTLLQLLRATLIEFTGQWDELLPWCARCYNGAYHRAINNTPFYLMFMRDARIPYDVLLPHAPHDSVPEDSQSVLAHRAARCLDLARKAIAGSQEARLERANDKASKITFEIGDIVYARQVHVNKRDYKILPKYYGPFRIIDLRGPNSAVIKSFRTGRTSNVSLRNIKLVHHEWLSKTDHPSVMREFPLEQDSDLPTGVEGVSEIRNHEELTQSTGETRFDEGDADPTNPSSLDDLATTPWSHAREVFQKVPAKTQIDRNEVPDSERTVSYSSGNPVKNRPVGGSRNRPVGGNDCPAETRPVGSEVMDHPVGGPATRTRASTRGKTHTPADSPTNRAQAQRTTYTPVSDRLTRGPAAGTRAQVRQAAGVRWLTEDLVVADSL